MATDPTPNYSVLVITFSDELEATDPRRWRMCKSEDEARAYVEKLHDEGWDEKQEAFKEGCGFDAAALYEIQVDGALKMVDYYETVADASGNAIGWTEGR